MQSSKQVCLSHAKLDYCSRRRTYLNI